MAKKRISKSYQSTSRPKGKRRPGKRRLVILSTLAVLLVGLGVVTALRWRAWFGNSPEEPYRTPEHIDRLTLTPGLHFESERTISWRCGEALQDAWLEYRQLGQEAWTKLPASGQLIETRSGKGCYYSAQLTGLGSGDSIVYRVRTGSVTSSEQHFVMPQGLDSLTRFVYLGDVQDPTGTMSRELFAQLREAHLPRLEPDLITCAGDQIEGPSDAYWQVWYEAIGSELSASLPWVMATGNHEYLKRGLSRELDPRWCAQYPYPHNGPEGFEGRSYYIDLPLMRLIVLDTTDINEPWSAYSHRSWMEKVLRSSAQPWQIVVMHHAVEAVRQGRSNLLMRYAIGPMLEDYGADLVLQGHDHAYSRRALRSTSGQMQTPVYVISSSSPKVYRNGFDTIHDRLGSGLQLLQSIQVRPESLHYQSYLYTGELYDEIQILHSGQAGEPHQVVDKAGDIPELFLFDAFGSSSKGRAKAEAYQAEVAQRKRQRP